MSRLSDEEIFQEIGNIVANFELYKCDECAVAVMRWLRDNNIEGRVIKLKTAYGEDYILSTYTSNKPGYRQFDYAQWNSLRSGGYR